MKKIMQVILTCLIVLYSASISAQSFIDVFKLGSTQHDEVLGIFQDSQGYIYLSGNFEGTVDFDPGAGEALMTAMNKYDGFVAKYDENRNFIWAISIKGQEWIYGRNLVVDSEGNIYVAGYFRGEADFDPGPEEYILTGVELDGFVAKYDHDGNFVWAFDIGNDNNCSAFDIAFDNVGNLWVSGDFRGEIDLDPSSGVNTLTDHGFQDAFMAKYSPDGEYIWAGSIGGELSTFYQPSLVCDESGNLYYAGYFTNKCDLDPGAGSSLQESAGVSDMFVLKLNSNGDFQWGFSMGGELEDQIRDIICHNDKIFIAGFFETEIDFDPSPATAIFTSSFDHSAFLAVYTTDGEYEMAADIEGNAQNCLAQGYSIEVDDDLNIYLTGSFFGTVDFDPSSSSRELTSIGDWDTFLAKYDQNGNLDWAIQAGSNDSDYGYNSLLSNDQETIMVCGKFKGQCIFDNAGTGYAIYAAGGFDGFLATYAAYDGAGIEDQDNMSTNIKVYPNPATHVLNVSVDNFTIDELKIYTLSGQQVLLTIPENNTIDISSLKTGMYFVEVNVEGRKVRQKLLVHR